MIKRISLLVTAALLVATMAMAVLAGPAFAQIREVPTACETKGGGTPPGQQPACQGGGLVQETENQNPSGKAPPGQNK